MVFLVRGRGAENIEEKIKTDRRKTLVNEDKEKRRIYGKPINNNDQPVEVTGFIYPRKYFLSYVYPKDLYKNLKEIEISKL